jgi:hypothetical protein
MLPNAKKQEGFRVRGFHPRSLLLLQALMLFVVAPHCDSLPNTTKQIVKR